MQQREAARTKTRSDVKPSGSKLISWLGKWAGAACIAAGWAIALVAIVWIDSFSIVSLFELAAFASALFGFGAGWYARGGRL